MASTSVASAADTGDKFEKAAKAEKFETVADREEKPERASHVRANPNDSMKSTWRYAKDKSQYDSAERSIEFFRLQPTDINRPVPKHAKTDKMSYLPHWEAHKWVLAHAIWPLAAHQIFNSVLGKHLPTVYGYSLGSTLPTILGLGLYVLAFNLNAVHEIHQLRELGHKHGFLDGDKHDRDQIPDGKAEKVMNSLGLTAVVRPMLAVLFAYRASKSPLETLSWWLPLEIGLYGIVLDFYYYWYHRTLHESETLWKYHRTHHLTKHPTVLLSLYADGVQEFFDIVGIPLLTYATMRLVGLPMPFTDWWMCQQYVVWTELWGHSGLRILVTPPTTATPFLKLFDAELLTEDHDLHHRKGWKNSHNYGKQTRLWDVIFGTTHERYETIQANIDWNSPASLPLW